MFSHLCHDSDERIESCKRILDSEQNMGLVTFLAGFAILNCLGLFQLRLEFDYWPGGLIKV